MRSAPADSHDDMIVLLACFAAMVNRPLNSLSDKARSIVVDMIDEISGQIEADKLDQQVEADWHEYEMNRRAA
jgi:hypothetical protein